MTGFAGTRHLVRLALRRDRIVLPAGVLVVLAIMSADVSGFARLYPTAAARVSFAGGANTNTAELFLYGPVREGATLGGLVSWRSAVVGGVILGLISFFTVIRHTRAEEESGRAELVRSAVVGPRAPLTAGLLVALLAALATGVLMVPTMTAGGLPASGAVALAAGTAAAGWVFAGVGAVAAQLTEGARTARGVAAVALAAAFLVRALGDASRTAAGGRLDWLSPLGWIELLHPFAGDRWWVLGLPAAATASLTAAAFVLCARRDLGSGMLRTGLGRAAAPPRLRSSTALAWRLHRPSLLGWTAALLVVGAVVGGAGDGIQRQLDGSAALERVLRNLGGTGALADAYLATSMGILGMLAAAYAVQAALRAHGEESAGRAEPVLATRTTRIGWAAGHLAFAWLGPAVALAAGGLAAGLVYGAATHQTGREVPRLLGAALVQLPAVWTLAAITAALFGLVPRWVPAAWGVLVAFLVLGQTGAALGWSQRVLDLSPFTHVPRLPSAAFSIAPLGWLLLVAASLTAAGLVGFRRRAVAQGQ